MPRLNLDIFGSDAVENAAPATASPAVPSTPQSVSKKTETAKSDSIAVKNPAVRFIPVGFHERHLRLLDDAVLSLRRKGNWGASKSAIIRALIEKHAQELDALWLAGND